MNFNSTIFERGRRYLKQGRVQVIKADNNRYEAKVIGSQPYDVSAVLINGKVISMECNCPYSQGGKNCKHEAALYQYILLNQVNEKKEKKKTVKVVKRDFEDEIDKRFKEAKRARGTYYAQGTDFINRIDLLFSDEKIAAEKKMDNDIFNRWFAYINLVYEYLVQEHWVRNYWSHFIYTYIDELIKSKKYRDIFIQALVNRYLKSNCAELDSMISKWVDKLELDDRITYDVKIIDLEKDEKEKDQMIFDALIRANHQGEKEFIKYFDAFSKFKESYSYYYISILSSEDEAEVIYDIYKKKYGTDIELEAIVKKDKSSIRKFYNTLAITMDDSYRNIFSLARLIELYGDDWIDVCEDFYKVVKPKVRKTEFNEIIFGAGDWRYAFSVLLNGKGYKLDNDLLELVKHHNSDMAKHLQLRSFIRQIENDRKTSYFWLDNIIREFRYRNSKEDTLEALAYAKQRFSYDSDAQEWMNRAMETFVGGEDE